MRMVLALVFGLIAASPALAQSNNIATPEQLAVEKACSDLTDLVVEHIRAGREDLASKHKGQLERCKPILHAALIRDSKRAVEMTTVGGQNGNDKR